MLTFPDSLARSSDAERPAVVLEAGSWEYEGTGIVAVGARDVTLGEAADPLMVGRRDQEPEAVLLPLSEIIKDERLNWALQAGTKLDDGFEPLFKVPWSVWQEHAAEPVRAWLPECDATGIDRSLAAAEREFRFAKQAADAAGLVRHYLVLLATRLGRSRREVGETLGLSTGRVQQLNENLPGDLAKEVEEFVSAAACVASAIGEGPCPRDDVPRPPELGSDELDQVVTSMLVLGLLEEVAGSLLLTDDGRSLIDLAPGAGAKLREQKASADRERAGDATR
jgi:hypothetical protein